MLGWKGHNEQSFQVTKEFLSPANILWLDEYILNETINIRRKKSIKLADAVIAATCRVYNLILITNNERDYKGIVEIANPLKIHA